jgi:hypothetical protein
MGIRRSPNMPKPGAFQNEQHFICFLMLMDSDAGTLRHLLGPQGDIV